MSTQRSPLRFLHLLWLVPLWLLQYLLIVPLVWIWLALIVPAFKIGVVGVILLCVPIIGWIILAVLILRRPQPRRERTYWRPWGASLIGGAR